MRDLEQWQASTEGGLWSWPDRRGAVEVRFVGKRLATAGTESAEEILECVLPKGLDAARLQQVHSASVVEARAEENGPGDALFTGREGLALCVVVADCVPVLLAAGDRIAAVHAGWRGLAAGILPATLDRLRAGPRQAEPRQAGPRQAGPRRAEPRQAGPQQAESVTAWIGPAIGPCCYEVGHDVAERVSASCAGDVVRPGRGERPHLDLVAAAESQLRERGVVEIRKAEVCTRCQAERLWSYRRDGAGCGRNLALIWRA